jgi:hypothetical protein
MYYITLNTQALQIKIAWHFQKTRNNADNRQDDHKYRNNFFKTDEITIFHFRAPLQEQTFEKSTLTTVGLNTKYTSSCSNFIVSLKQLYHEPWAGLSWASRSFIVSLSQLYREPLAALLSWA